jgi:hypothetical protein
MHKEQKMNTDTKAKTLFEVDCVWTERRTICGTRYVLAHSKEEAEKQLFEHWNENDEPQHDIGQGEIGHDDMSDFEQDFEIEEVRIGDATEAQGAEVFEFIDDHQIT